MSRRFFVYIHRKPNGDPFYVGKGLFERARSFTHRNPHYRNVVMKYGSDNISVEIFPCESERDALDREVVLIAELRAKGFDLTNKTNGGDGVSGLVNTPEQVARRTAAIRATFAKNGKKPNPSSQREAARRNALGNKNCVGRKVTAEVRAKIAEKVRGNKSALGKHDVSEVGRRRMSEVNVGNKRALGHIPSAEIRAQWSEKRKAYAQTPEGKAHQAKITEAARLANLRRKEESRGDDKCAAIDCNQTQREGDAS